MHRPQTMNEYIELVQQAIFEVDELRVAAEWGADDGEGVGFEFTEPLNAQLRQLVEDLTTNHHVFGGGDLALMTLVRTNARNIPFKNLLDIINQTHRLGLET